MGKKDKDNIKKPMENQEPELQDTKDTQEQEPLAENDQKMCIRDRCQSCQEKGTNTR